MAAVVFDETVSALKQYASDKGIRLFGDPAIFVGMTSRCVGNRDLSSSTRRASQT